ncbi:MAG: L-aspartate oxidase [Mycobacteriales bacterium]
MNRVDLPGRLSAPAAGWTTEADVVVVGSGIAGLTTALKARRSGRVLLVTKTVLDAGSTRWAQGGIAAALDPADSPAEHMADTLAAGVGICDEAAVRQLVQRGPGLVRELVELGTGFDRDTDGELALTLEGGHHRRRIAHARGDATGAEIERALITAVRAAGDIEIIEHALVLDLLLDGTGRACGVTLHVIDEGRRDGVGAALGRSVVLATGGLGQVYAATTNPPVSTGDGVALAMRAGAVVTDLEFVQFHPTVLWLGAGASGQQPLVSEAVRGEGAVLRDVDGTAFMDGRHPLADLAPRDVVSREIWRQMAATGSDHVLLDATALGRELIESRFPTIVASCRSHGVDPVTDPIPVAPAAHYSSGGVRTDLYGRTSIPGLYACGEVSCTGVHGANRLASNSLLEGLVFADAIAADISSRTAADSAAGVSHGGLPIAGDRGEPWIADPAGVTDIRLAMSQGAGVLRSAESLDDTAAALAKVGAGPSPDVASWEATNLLTVAAAITAAAAAREESRGSHWREDFGEPAHDFRGHLLTTLTDGELQTSYEPLR